MTKLTADSILDAIENDAPISADDFEERVAYKAKTMWCDMAYKGRFEKAADSIWDLLDELTQIIEINDMPEAAQAIFDIAEQSGKLSDIQEGVREWVAAEGTMYNFRRGVQDA